MLVLDASAALAWAFEDHFDRAATDLLARVRDHGAQVPGLFHLEVANGLLGAERHAGHAQAASVQFFQLLGDLDIRVDPATAVRAGAQIMDVARQHGLTSYDASYLELALRDGVPLATRVRRLAQAAAGIGLEVL